MTELRKRAGAGGGAEPDSTDNISDKVPHTHYPLKTPMDTGLGPESAFRASQPQLNKAWKLNLSRVGLFSKQAKQNKPGYLLSKWISLLAN